MKVKQSKIICGCLHVVL